MHRAGRKSTRAHGRTARRGNGRHSPRQTGARLPFGLLVLTCGLAVVGAVVGMLLTGGSRAKLASVQQMSSRPGPAVSTRLLASGRGSALRSGSSTSSQVSARGHSAPPGASAGAVEPDGAAAGLVANRSHVRAVDDRSNNSESRGRSARAVSAQPSATGRGVSPAPTSSPARAATPSRLGRRVSSVPRQLPTATSTVDRSVSLGGLVLKASILEPEPDGLCQRDGRGQRAARCTNGPRPVRGHRERGQRNSHRVGRRLRRDELLHGEPG